MLEMLHAIAFRLSPVRPFALAAMLGGAATFAWAAVSDAPDAYLMSGLLAALWGGWLFTLVVTFQRLPHMQRGSASLAARLRGRIRRAGYLTMAWLLIAAAAAGAILSVRLVSLSWPA